jgi:DNA topoisomerase VI subunit A
MLHALRVIPIIAEAVSHPSVALSHVKEYAKILNARFLNVAPKDVLSQFSRYWEGSTSNI